MEIKVGDLVKFQKDLYDDEKDTIYEILEINGDRCFIALVATHMAIRPQSVAMMAELVLVKDALIPR